MLSSRSFIVLHFIFRSAIHLELIFMEVCMATLYPGRFSGLWWETLRNGPFRTNSRSSRFGYCLLWQWRMPCAQCCFLYNITHCGCKSLWVLCIALVCPGSRRTNINKLVITFLDLLWVIKSSVSDPRVVCLLQTKICQSNFSISLEGVKTWHTKRSSEGRMS